MPIKRTYQVVKDTLVELPFGLAALPQLVVVVVKALPVLAELLEAVLVDILDAVSTHVSRIGLCGRWVLVAQWDVHAGGTAGDAAALLQTLELALAGVLGLALHVVIVVGAAAGADEERGGEQRGRSGANLLDGGDRVGEGGGVDEDLLVEPAGSQREPDCTGAADRRGRGKAAARLERRVEAGKGKG